MITAVQITCTIWITGIKWNQNVQRHPYKKVWYQDSVINNEAENLYVLR